MTEETGSLIKTDLTAESRARAFIKRVRSPLYCGNEDNRESADLLEILVADLSHVRALHQNETMGLHKRIAEQRARAERAEVHLRERVAEMEAELAQARGVTARLLAQGEFYRRCLADHLMAPDEAGAREDAERAAGAGHG